MTNSDNYFMLYIEPDDQAVLRKECEAMNDHLEARGKERYWTIQTALQDLVRMGIFELKCKHDSEGRIAAILKRAEELQGANEQTATAIRWLEEETR